MEQERKRKASITSEDEVENSSKQHCVDTATADDTMNNLVDKIFDDFKHESDQQQQSQSADYVTFKQFQEARLNVIQQPESVEIGANFTKFNKFLDEYLNTQSLSDVLSNQTLDDQCRLIYTFLLAYFNNVLKDSTETMKLIMIVLNGILIFQDRLPNSAFVNRINSITKCSSDDFDFKKLSNKTARYLKSILGGDKTLGDAVPKNESHHFKEFPNLYDLVSCVFDLCNQITKIGTYKNINFKQMINIKVKSQDPNQSQTLARCIQLQSPIMLKLLTKQVNDGFALYTCEEEVCDYIVNMIKTSVLFPFEQTFKPVESVFYRNIAIGELKKMTTLNLYETAKPFTPTVKNSINPQTYIIVNAINIIYNENGDKFGLSIKCWGQNHSFDSEFGNNRVFQVIDTTINKDYTTFLE